MVNIFKIMEKYCGAIDVNFLCTGPVSRSCYSVDTSYVFGCLYYVIYKFIYKLHERTLLFLVDCKVGLSYEKVHIFRIL